MNVKDVIRSHGMTISEVAENLGINRVSLSNMVTVRGCNPKYQTLKRIADVVGCDVMDFFKDEATHQQPQEACSGNNPPARLVYRDGVYVPEY